MTVKEMIDILRDCEPAQTVTIEGIDDVADVVFENVINQKGEVETVVSILAI